MTTYPGCRVTDELKTGADLPRVVQTRLQFWSYPPARAECPGAVVALLCGDRPLAYAGPFYGGDVTELAGLLWQAAEGLGADGWQVWRK